MSDGSRWGRIGRITLGAAISAAVLGCSDSTGFTVGTTGSVRAFTVTTGTNIDGDGYVVTVGGATREVAPNGGAVFSDIPAGEVEVELSEVSVNCLSSAASMTRTVTVMVGETVETTFTLICI